MLLQTGIVPTQSQLNKIHKDEEASNNCPHCGLDKDCYEHKYRTRHIPQRKYLALTLRTVWFKRMTMSMSSGYTLSPPLSKPFTTGMLHQIILKVTLTGSPPLGQKGLPIRPPSHGEGWQKAALCGGQSPCATRCAGPCH